MHVGTGVLDRQEGVIERRKPSIHSPASNLLGSFRRSSFPRIMRRLNR
jgi:hypothetical protein